jgi:hypothetical protein
MTEEEYNGWVNFETWATALHLSNDYDLYQTIIGMRTNIELDVAENGSPTEVWTKEQAIRFVFEDTLKEYVEQTLSTSYWKENGAEMPDLFVRMQDDVGSLWRVNWRDVANSFFDE